MRVTVDWLREFVDFDLTPEDLADRLTMVGLEVDEIERIGEGIDERVVIGRVLSVEKHPNADRLRICRVDVGEKTLQIVCGAPNVREGMLAPTALIGTRLPIGMTVKVAKLRGVESHGMLCSERELGLSEEASGLMELPEEMPVGAKVREALGLPTVVIEFELTPNRPDCLSVYGIAREISVVTGNPLRPVKVDLVEEGPTVKEVTSVIIEAPDLCPRYTARVILGVRIGPSPWWMRWRLNAVGLRPINNVVDITNYVLMELGHPLHAFDYRKLAENRIVVRKADEGEELVTLDGIIRRLRSDMLVIADAQKAVALAGVMGGEETEVTDQTVDVLLESAYFDPISIRKTSKALGMHTEASHRFERGTDIEGLVTASARATQLIQQIAGGRICRGMADAYPKRRSQIYIRFRPQRCNYLLGTEISADEMEDMFRRLKFNLSREADGTMSVEAPTFRPDIEREVDLIEEVARIYGYEKIPTFMPRGEVPEAQLNPRDKLRDMAREIMLSAGLSEAINYSFYNPDWFDMIMLPDDDPRRRTMKLRNPLSEEQSVMRTTLVPSLLENVSWNIRHQVREVRLFELAKTFWPETDDPNELPVEREMLGGVLSGSMSSGTWCDPEREPDFFDLKGIVEELLDRFGVRGLRFVRSKEPFLHPGRSADLILKDGGVGFIGEVHPDVLERWDIPQRVYIFELDFDALVEESDLTRRFAQIPQFPKVTRDIALLVDRDLPAERVTELIRTFSPLVSSVRMFDLYEGDRIPAGYKSLAYSIDFVSYERTLTDEEVEEEIKRLLEVLNEEVGAKLRS
jgi:phenylalanyl-tRNA synthetase beta chain